MTKIHSLSVLLSGVKNMFNLNHYQGFIFDFDGTLVDSMGLWHDIDRLYLTRRNISCPDNLSRCVAGMSFPETAEYFKTRFQLPDDIEAIQQEWIDMSHHFYLSDIGFKTGVLDFIRHLREARLPMAIASSNNRLTTEAYLEQHGLLSDFKALCFTGEAGAGKPNPAVFLCAAKAMAVPPEHCLVFEDTFEGLKGAKNAGMTAVAVDDAPYQDREAVLSIADYYTCDYHTFERL